MLKEKGERLQQKRNQKKREALAPSSYPSPKALDALKTEGVAQVLSSTGFASLLEKMREGVLLIGEDQRLHLCTPRARDLLSLELEVGAPYKEQLRDDFFGFSLARHLKAQSEPPSTLLSIPSDNTLRHVEIIATYVKETSQSGGLLIIVRDLTAAQRLQAALARHERLESIGELTASLAHEIRNPLSAIEGFAQLLKEDLSKEQERGKERELLEHILEGARAVRYLMNHMLDYAKPIATKIKREEVTTLVRECAAMAIASNWITPSKLSLELPQEYKIPHDRHLLKASLLNILRNAAQALSSQTEATSKKGQIHLRLEEQEQELCIHVRDEGEGIDPKNLKKIFSPFFTTKKEGTGLGLSQVDKMMQAQGGSVKVRSKLGEGTEMTLVLPKRAAIIDTSFEAQPFCELS